MKHLKLVHLKKSFSRCERRWAGFGFERKKNKSAASRLQHCNTASARKVAPPPSSAQSLYMGWVLFIVIVSGIWILFMFRWLGLIKIGRCVPYRLTGRPSIQYIRQYAYYRAKSGWWVCSPGTVYTVCAVSAAPTWLKKDASPLHCLASMVTSIENWCCLTHFQESGELNSF